MIRVIRRSRARMLAVALAYMLPAVSLAQVPQPPVLLPPEPETATGGSIPLSWDDAIFRSVTSSGAVTLSNGGSLTDKSITATGSQASVQCNGACTINRVRISSREGIRVGGSGAVVVTNSWVESQGTGSDHADSIQCYAPGRKGSLTVRNSMIRAHNTAATAGVFCADDYEGDFRFENVVFWGGPYGLRIHSDGNPTTVDLKDVYFVGPFGYGKLMIDNGGSGSRPTIVRWENVRNATIENGKLVPGSLIPKPY